MTTVLLVVGALLLGAVLSHYAWPQTVLAQVQTPAPQAPTTPQQFTFVNRNNELQATFSVGVDEKNRRINYLFKATNGRMWSGSLPFDEKNGPNLFACGN